MAIVDELVTLLGIEVDPAAQTTAYKFGFLLGEVGKAAVAMGAVLATAAGAIVAWTAVQADAIDKEQELAATLGVSYEAYQKLAYAAKLSGGSTATLNADLERLQENLLNPATGVQNKALTALGIHAKDAGGKLKSADVIVAELAGKFDKLTTAEQNTYAKLLRISPAMVRLLQNGEKGLKEMGAEAEALGIILDKKAAQSAAEFGDSLDRVKATTEGVGRSIAVGLLPGLTKVVDGFTGWIKENRKLISMGITQVVEGVGKGFQMVGKAISTVWGFVSQFLPVLDDLNEDFDATQAIAIAVALAIGAAGVAAAIAAAPFIAMGLAIGAVVLIIEDLYAAFTGGDSVIGGWVGSITEGMSTARDAVVLAISDMMTWLSDGLTGAFKYVLVIVESVFGAIKGIIDGVLSLVTKAVSAIKSIGSSESLAAVSAASRAGAVPVPAGIQAAASQTGGNTISPTIIVNGAGDPAAVGQEVVQRGGLGQTLQQSRPGARGPVTG